MDHDYKIVTKYPLIFYKHTFLNIKYFFLLFSSPMVI